VVTHDEEPAARFDGEDLDLASGLIFALDVCLSDVEVGEVLELSSTNPALAHELPAWCRGTGHELLGSEPDGGRIRYLIRRGGRGSLMFKDRPDWGVTPEFRRDGFDTRDWLVGKVADIPGRADPTTGFSPRGAVVEAGGPAFPYTETERDRVWCGRTTSPPCTSRRPRRSGTHRPTSGGGTCPRFRGMWSARCARS
jgi:TusA-related sulfurtransferase